MQLSITKVISGMKRIFLLFLLVTSCSNPVRQTSQRELQEQRNPVTVAVQKRELQLKPIAGDRSEPLFAEAIDHRAKAANLSPLRKKAINRDDLEFRVWVGFGKKPLEGFIIKRENMQWDGMFLESMNVTNKPPYCRQLSPPKSGWERLYSEVIDNGLFVLPDSSQFPVPDGTSYVVEIKKGGVYRTYSYLTPDSQRWQEAKKMLRIVSILYTGFGIER